MASSSSMVAPRRFPFSETPTGLRLSSERRIFLSSRSPFCRPPRWWRAAVLCKTKIILISLKNRRNGHTIFQSIYFRRATFISLLSDRIDVWIDGRLARAQDQRGDRVDRARERERTVGQRALPRRPRNPPDSGRVGRRRERWLAVSGGVLLSPGLANLTLLNVG